MNLIYTYCHMPDFIPRIRSSWPNFLAWSKLHNVKLTAADFLSQNLMATRWQLARFFYTCHYATVMLRNLCLRRLKGLSRERLLLLPMSTTTTSHCMWADFYVTFLTGQAYSSAFHEILLTNVYSHLHGYQWCYNESRNVCILRELVDNCYVATLTTNKIRSNV
jgi:hypothetical protein